MNLQLMGSRRTDAVLARRNPVAKLGAGVALTLALIASLDPVTPTLILAVELAALPWFGLSPRSVARTGSAVLMSAGGLLITLIIFAGERTGSVLFAAGPLVVTTGVLTTALAFTLRLMALGLPGVLIFATTDPADLAESLIEHCRVPARFAIGALAAFRLVPTLGHDWSMISRARRARGVDAGRNPIRRLQLFASTMFGLLVGAIRHATRLATAMDARGFDSRAQRAVTRPQPFTVADVALIVGAVVVATVAISVSVAVGAFTPVLA